MSTRDFDARSLLPWSFLLLAWLPAIFANAQSPHFRKHAFPQEFRQAKVLHIYENPNGFLWFGTNRGLFRFDGLEFEKIDLDTDDQGGVTSVHADSKKALWVGCKNGDIYRSSDQHRFDKWDPEEGLPKVPINGFAESEDGTVWIATYGEGLYFWRNERLYNVDMEDGLVSDDIYTIDYKASVRQIIIGTDRGLHVLSADEPKQNIRTIGADHGLPDLIVQDVEIDETGGLWIGFYDNGFCYLQSDYKTVTHVVEQWPFGTVTRLMLFEHKELWVGTQKHGLYRYDLAHSTLSDVEISGQAIASVNELLKDVEGNIWMGINSHFVYSANRQFEIVRPAPNNIQAILIDRKQNSWIGTPEGLFFWDKNGRRPHHFKPISPLIGRNIISLYEDAFDNLWIGTFGDGLFLYNPQHGETRHISSAQGLANENILAIEGTDQYVWLASLGGVIEVRNNVDIMRQSTPQIRHYGQAEGLGTQFIYDIFIDSQERVWFATDGHGLYSWHHGVIKHHTQGQDLKIKSIYSIAEDHAGHIWFSTPKQGIFKLSDDELSNLAVKEGIRDLAIVGMMADAKGNILIVHPSGIDILDPLTHHLIYYDDEVGVENMEPNINAMARDNAGNIYVGTREKLIVYSALNEDLEIHPRTNITQVTINVEPVENGRKPRFKHNQNNFVFDYVGLWYTDPETVKYRYKLEGFNDDWIISKDRRAVYPNLRSGKYVFRISSTENDAFAHEPVASYAFEVLSPLWLRPWFLIGCIALLAGLVYWLFRQRIQRMERVALLTRQKIKSQYETLRSQINPHFLFNSFNTLIGLIDENPRAAGEFTEKLSDFYRSILQYREKDLIPLSEELQLVRDYAYLLKERYQKGFRIDIKESTQPAFIPPLTLQLLLENALKHNIASNQKPLTVAIDSSDGKNIFVRNNLQLKRSTEPSTGFGLESVRSRYALFSNDAVEITQYNGHFEVRLPQIKTTIYESDHG